MYVKIGKYPKKVGDRKFKVKVSDHDVYSADTTLAVVILPVLKKIKEKKCGAPHVDNADVPENLWRPDGVVEFDVDDNWQARWSYVLDAMIWSFEQLHPDGYEWEDQFYSGDADYDFVESEFTDTEGNRTLELKYGPNHTLEFDYEGYNAHSQRIDEGLRLFGKYYRGLWT